METVSAEVDMKESIHTGIDLSALYRVFSSLQSHDEHKDAYNRAFRKILDEKEPKYFESFDVGDEDENGIELFFHKNGDIRKLFWSYDPTRLQNYGDTRIEIIYNFRPADWPNIDNADKQRLAFQTELCIYDPSDFYIETTKIRAAYASDSRRAHRHRGAYPTLEDALPQWVISLHGIYVQDRFNPYQILADSSWHEKAIEELPSIVKAWCLEHFNKDWQSRVWICNKKKDSND